MAGKTIIPEIAQPYASQALPAHQSPPPTLARPLNGSGSDAVPAVTEPRNPSRLTFDDIAEKFDVPIADAAVALGVCSSVLKRLCRENGIARWPYRKFLAGKSVEDIKREAAREKGRALAELSKSGSASSMPALRETKDIRQKRPKPLKPISGPAQVEARSPDGPGLIQPIPDIPGYVDEFRYGFPSGGLASVSRKWWSTPDAEGSSMDNDEPFHKLDGPDASSSLCSLRRKAVEDGENFLSVGFASPDTSQGGERDPL